jgi:hypothetical protein
MAGGQKACFRDRSRSNRRERGAFRRLGSRGEECDDLPLMGQSQDVPGRADSGYLHRSVSGETTDGDLSGAHGRKIGGRL